MRVSPNIYVLSVSANGYQWYPDGLTKYIFDYYRSVATTMISWWSPLTPLHKWWSHPRYVQTCWFRRGSDPKMRCLLQSGRKISFENFWLKYPWQRGVCGRGRVPAEAWGGHAYWRTSKLLIFIYWMKTNIVAALLLGEHGRLHCQLHGRHHSPHPRRPQVILIILTSLVTRQWPVVDHKINNRLRHLEDLDLPGQWPVVTSSVTLSTKINNHNSPGTTLRSSRCC